MTRYRIKKAEELIEKYQKDKIITLQRSSSSPVEEYELTDNEAKYCALIFVNEMILECRDYNSERESYWLNVKQELETLWQY